MVKAKKPNFVMRTQRGLKKYQTLINTTVTLVRTFFFDADVLSSAR